MPRREPAIDGRFDKVRCKEGKRKVCAIRWNVAANVLIEIVKRENCSIRKVNMTISLFAINGEISVCSRLRGGPGRNSNCEPNRYEVWSRRGPSAA